MLHVAYGKEEAPHGALQPRDRLNLPRVGILKFVDEEIPELAAVKRSQVEPRERQCARFDVFDVVGVALFLECAVARFGTAHELAHDLVHDPGILVRDVTAEVRRLDALVEVPEPVELFQDGLGKVDVRVVGEHVLIQKFAPARAVVFVEKPSDDFALFVAKTRERRPCAQADRRPFVGENAPEKGVDRSEFELSELFENRKPACFARELVHVGHALLELTEHVVGCLVRKSDHPDVRGAQRRIGREQIRDAVDHDRGLARPRARAHDDVTVGGSVLDRELLRVEKGCEIRKALQVVVRNVARLPVDDRKRTHELSNTVHRHALPARFDKRLEALRLSGKKQHAHAARDRPLQFPRVGPIGRLARKKERIRGPSGFGGIRAFTFDFGRAVGNPRLRFARNPHGFSIEGPFMLEHARKTVPIAAKVRIGDAHAFGFDTIAGTGDKGSRRNPTHDGIRLVELAHVDPARKIEIQRFGQVRDRLFGIAVEQMHGDEDVRQLARFGAKRELAALEPQVSGHGRRAFDVDPPTVVNDVASIPFARFVDAFVEHHFDAFRGEHRPEGDFAEPPHEVVASNVLERNPSRRAPGFRLGHRFGKVKRATRVVTGKSNLHGVSFAGNARSKCRTGRVVLRARQIL